MSGNGGLCVCVYVWCPGHRQHYDITQEHVQPRASRDNQAGPGECPPHTSHATDKVTRASDDPLPKNTYFSGCGTWTSDDGAGGMGHVFRSSSEISGYWY